MNNLRKILFFLIFNLLFLPNFSKGVSKLTIYILDSKTFKIKSSFEIQNKWEEGISICAIDLGGDGISEIAISGSDFSNSLIEIYTLRGELINSFYAYEKSFKGGIDIACGDLDQDGKGEIVVVPKDKKPAKLKIFNGYGEKILGKEFYVFDPIARNGATVAIGNIGGDKKKEIIIGSPRFYDPEIFIFTYDGRMINKFKVFGFDKYAGIFVSIVDLGKDGINEILVSSRSFDLPKIAIYRLDGSLINWFYVYDLGFRGGVKAKGFDILRNGKEEILVVPNMLGFSHLRIFSGYGKEVLPSKFLIKDDREGINLVLGDLEGDGEKELIVTKHRFQNYEKKYRKYIEIDLTKQKFYYYQYGIKLADLLTSTGKKSTPTKTGHFKILSKLKVAYGAGDGQFWKMPYWLGVYRVKNQENGIHALPYINGIKETKWSLGRPVSHGCIRLEDNEAIRLYNWAEIKDDVIIHK